MRIDEIILLIFRLIDYLQVFALVSFQYDILIIQSQIALDQVFALDI